MQSIRRTWLYVLIALLASPHFSAYAAPPPDVSLMRAPVADSRLSDRDRAVVQRQRNERSVDWVQLVRIDPSVLQRSQFEIDLYDRKGVVKQRGLPNNFGTREVWHGRIVLAGDRPDWDPGSLRDVWLYPAGDGKVRGLIYADDIVYRLRPLSDGVHALIRQDLSRLHSDQDDVQFRPNPVGSPKASSSGSSHPAKDL